MTKNSTSPTNSKWTGMVPADDTALAVTDTDNPGVPVVYLNGQFATQGYWRRVIAELGTGWRHPGRRAAAARVGAESEH
jgi:hypothetical protein